MKPKYQIPSAILEAVSIKNVKKGFGHDLLGFFCDIYLNKKKVGYFNDDGWGGETDISLTIESEKELQKLFDQNNLSELMFTKGDWNFYDSKDQIEFKSQLDEVISFIDYNNQAKKFHKTFLKSQEKGIVFGTMERYEVISWKGKKLHEMASVPQHKLTVQVKLKEIKRKLKDGETILNTNLKELGFIN